MECRGERKFYWLAQKSPCRTFSSSGGGRNLFQFKTILEDLKQLGGPVQEIRATGGFADSPVFRQIMADVLGETLSFTDSTEASALGAVLLGWQGLGSYQICKQRRNRC